MEPFLPEYPAPPVYKCLQVEYFVVLGRPVGVLGLGDLAPLLVREVRPDEADLDEGLERLHLGPPQVVGGDHCNGEEEDNCNVKVIPVILQTHWPKVAR